jgi:hypothetical protein
MKEMDNGCNIKFIKNDLKRGMHKNIVKYLLFILFIILSLIIYNRMIHSGITDGKITGRPGFFDRLIYLFAGNRAFNSNIGNTFSFEPIWFVMATMPSFIVYSYAVADIEGIGQQFLLRVKDKRIWWLSKCIWNISSIIVLYVVMYITIFLITIFDNYWCVKDIFIIHSDICGEINGILINNNIEIIELLIIVPFIINMGVSLLQMTFSFILNPAISFLLVIVMNVLSSFFETNILPNGYTIIIRWNIEGGRLSTPIMGIFIGIVCAVFGIVTGLMYFKKMDIIERKE